MRAIQDAIPTGLARTVATEAGESVPRPRAAAPAGEFLGAGEGGLEFWLSGGRVYSHPPSGGRGSHVCRLAAPNRLLKQDRRAHAAGSPTDSHRG